MVGQRLLAVALLLISGDDAGAFAPSRRRGAPSALRMSQQEALPMTDENVEAVLDLAREELGAMFGYVEDSKKVGITGTVDFVETNGPNVILRLDGRFWHERTRVITRLQAFLQERIPEICEVEIEDEAQLDDHDKRADKALW